MSQRGKSVKMGRKFAQTKSESFADLNQHMSAERDKKAERMRNQWNDLHKYVPVYELNHDENDASNELPKASDFEKKRKTAPLRNSGESSKGLLLSDILKEVDSLATKQDQKYKRKAAKYVRMESVPKINGAEALGAPPSKRSKNPNTSSRRNSIGLENGSALNGSHVSNKSIISNESSNNSATFIELEDLKAGPVVATRRSSSFVEEEEVETSANYFVTSPSDEEDEEETGPAIYSTFVNFDFDDNSADDSEEYYDGIDLMEDSDEEFEDDDESIGESEADFVVNDDYIEEAEPDELDRAEAVLNAETRRKRKAKIERDSGSDDSNNLSSSFAVDRPKRASRRTSFDLPDEDYDSSGDEDFNMSSDESMDEEDLESDVDEDELGDLLEDITGGGDSDGEFVDESDEERVLNLDPMGLKLKAIGLQIQGYVVDESVRKFIDIQKDDDSKSAHQLPAYSLFGFSKNDEHSVYTAIKAFKWLIGPFDVQEFFEGIYSKRAMIIRRQDSAYYKNVFPISSFYQMFQQNFLEYSVNVNVAKYENGVRTTHNPVGRAYAGAIRAFVDQGMSVQCVNPQSFDTNIRYICDLLQEMFNCFVGANCYFTPKGNAGFAPHFDDIDAFLLQTEGRKHWKVYAPSDEDQWPLESSHNFTLEEMEERKDNLVFDGWLNAGDVLYLPRGFIHCANTDSKHDSLHITISVGQNHSYCNLIEKVTNKLLEAKTAEIAQLRRNLPVNLLDMCGVAYSTYENDSAFPKFLETPISLYIEQFQIGLASAIPASVDDIAREFMRKALPPLLTDYEKQYSIHGLTNKLPTVPEFTKNTQVRVLRKHTQRLLFESENKAFLIHRLENSMVYEGRPEVTVDVPSKLITIIENLLRSYPNWESIESIGKKLERNFAVVEFLFTRGLLMAREPPSSNSPKKQMNGKKSRKHKK